MTNPAAYTARVPKSDAHDWEKNTADSGGFICAGCNLISPEMIPGICPWKVSRLRAAIRAKSAARAQRRAQRILDNEALGAKKVKRGKKKKNPSLSKLKKLLWEEMRFVVYAESPDRCISCGSGAPPVACHIVPSGDGAIMRFFLPAIYRGCRSCNDDERRHRGRWRGKFEEIFGKDYVDALYAMSEEESRKPPEAKFQIKKWWVREQTERMRGLRGGGMKEGTDALGRRVVFNHDTKRAVIVAMFGLGCYEYDDAGGNATANHRGIVGTDAEAMEWLNGGSPKLLQIYKNGKPL